MEVKNGVLISISIDDILDETLVIPDVLEINDNLFNNLFKIFIIYSVLSNFIISISLRISFFIKSE